MRSKVYARKKGRKKAEAEGTSGEHPGVTSGSHLDRKHATSNLEEAEPRLSVEGTTEMLLVEVAAGDES